MPSQEATFSGETRYLDARPDRIDLRDRPYQPELRNLAPEFPSRKIIDNYFPGYRGLVLDQGREGSCTGFGLAAVINYLRLSQWIITVCRDSDQGEETDYFPDFPEIESVSPAMLYRLAKLYDEWPGEDYEGSSCRGAMKGWHKHGVCRESNWPYAANRAKEPDPSWKQDAAQIPIGSYYRVEKDSIADMQAAIQEVGAIYVAAMVHPGWDVSSRSRLLGHKSFPVIDYTPGEESDGGHAFSIVGYNNKGFIVQNSWGQEWGYHGFAILTYADWADHGRDAWVAVLGAPMEGIESPGALSSTSLRDRPHVASSCTFAAQATHACVLPLASNEEAYLRSIVTDNNGTPINRIVGKLSAKAAVKEACYNRPLTWFENSPEARDLVIYAHGGLNNEESSIRRIRKMAPWFEANGMCPIFVTWRTGALESIQQMIADEMKDIFPSLLPSESVRDWWEKTKKKIREAADRRVEDVCRRFLVRGIWSEMKENADLSASPGGGTHMLVSHLKALKKAKPNLRIHFIGHSAGSIVGGHLIDSMRRAELKLGTCHLYAPACTVEFANKNYIKAIRARTLAKRQLYVDLMDDERELADNVGSVGKADLYGKSLLYLVSRALEKHHKTSILGLHNSWNAAGFNNDVYPEADRDALETWQNFAGVNGSRIGDLTAHDKSRAQVSNGIKKIPLAHGSFDNDVQVVNQTFKRIINKDLDCEVSDLSDF